MNFLDKRSKGQFSIEYLVAFMLFASVLVYLSFQVAGTLPELRKYSQKSVELSKVHRVTDDLIQTPGYPSNWEEDGTAERYGLASEPYLLNEEKVRDFNKSCWVNYSSVKGRLGLNFSSFKISLYKSATGDVTLLDCGVERVPEGVSVQEIQRYAVVENSGIVRMVFKIW